MEEVYDEGNIELRTLLHLLNQTLMRYRNEDLMPERYARHIFSVLIFLFLAVPYHARAKSPAVAYDMEMAREICRSLPLDNVEGVWLYPDDKVSVLIIADDTPDPNTLPVYSISVVETSDARLHPGDVIGKLYATPQAGTFRIELSTERRNEVLLKPKSCLATLAKDGDSFIIKKQNPPFKGRLNLNFNRLLPGFWKIVSLGISGNNNRGNIDPPVGMVKIFPSYDGNESSRRKIRYL